MNEIFRNFASRSPKERPRTFTNQMVQKYVAALAGVTLQDIDQFQNFSGFCLNHEDPDQNHKNSESQIDSSINNLLKPRRSKIKDRLGQTKEYVPLFMIKNMTHLNLVEQHNGANQQVHEAIILLQSLSLEVKKFQFVRNIQEIFNLIVNTPPSLRPSPHLLQKFNHNFLMPPLTLILSEEKFDDTNTAFSVKKIYKIQSMLRRHKSSQT